MTASPLDITFDAAEVERLIMELGAIGQHSGTGVWRTCYSPEWVTANDLLGKWAAEAGMDVRRDVVGNVWGRIEGSEGGKAIASGSHVDTQCPGGRYDGALGILAALIAMKALVARYGQPKRPMEMVSLCEEEGSRFGTAAFWGSRALVGRTAEGDADKVMGYDGISIADAMREVGLDPALAHAGKRDDLAAFVELHIEQGPVLEDADKPCAIVDAITSIREVEYTLTGEANHAGAFPMDLRRDPMAAFCEIGAQVLAHTRGLGRPAVTTIGECHVEPGGTAIVPASVRFTIDARHPDEAAAQAMHKAHEAIIEKVAAEFGVNVEARHLISHAATPSDPEILAAMRDAAEAEQIGHVTMPSGAGHDSQQMAQICPVAMIFVRSKDGRSHTPEEFSSIEDIVEGIRLLTATLYRLAY